MKKGQIFLLIVGLLCILLFYLFSREVKRGFLKEADFATTVKIQEKIDTSSRLRLAHVVGEIMEGSTFFASPEVSVAIILLLTIFGFVDLKHKKIRFRALAIPILFALLIAGEVYGKNVVHHPSPPFFMIKNPTTIFPKYYINDEYSYPSGHAARAVYMSLAFYALLLPHLLQQKRKRLHIGIIVGILSYISIVAVSRIYLGHHWLSDIVGGGLLGIGLGLLTMRIISPIIDEQ